MIFLGRLAGHLKKTVGELLTGQSLPITAYELQFWQKFSLIEPFGFPQQDYHAGQSAWAAANVNFHSKPIERDAFQYQPPEVELDDEEIDAALAEEMAWDRVLSGKARKKA